MDFFALKKNGTSVKQEFNGGLTTFLAMMYIVPVNALIMSKAGMPIDALITATAVVTIFATILNGLWANTPVAMSVSMGLNAYFSFGLVIGMKIPWQSALGIVFMSGVLFVILSFVGFRMWVIKAIPLDIRRAISAGIGAFIGFIGMQQMGLVVDNPATLVGLGNLKDPNVLIGVFGLACIVAFYALKIRGAFVLAILLSSIFAWVVGIAPYPTEFFSLPASMAPIFFEFDIKSIFLDPNTGAITLALVPVIIVFFITDLFDSIGTLTGVGARANLFDGSEEGLGKMEKTLETDAVVTLGGAIAGVSTTTSFVESASGVEAGGRTGLTAVFCGLLFVLTLFLLPFFKAIPANAIYPVLIMVGVLMFSEAAQINFKDPANTVAAFFIVFVMPLTYSITNGLAFGFLSYILVKIVRREWSEINFGVIALGVISFVVFLMH